MDTKLTSRSHQLLLPTPESSLFCRILEYVPTELSQKPLGKLYIVAEIASPSQDSKEVGENLIESIKTEYYKDPARDVLESFESALQKANETLADLTENDKTDWLGKLHVIIAVLSNDTLHIAQAGHAEAYLARGEQIVKISEGLTETADEEKPQPLKTFENIASGNVEEGDRVIISTPELFYHVSLEELRRGTADKSPKDASEEIKQKLASEEGIGNLAALFIEITTEDKLAAEPLEAVTPKITPAEETVSDLKKDTATFADKTKSTFKSATSFLQSRFKQKEEPVELETEKSPTTTSAVPTPEPEISQKPSQLSAKAKSALGSVTSFIGKLKNSSLNQNRFFLGTVVVLILVLLVTGTILFFQGKSESAQKTYHDKLVAAQEKAKAANDALIYKNEIKARQLLAESSALIDEILASKYYHNEANKLKSEIQVILDKVNKITRPTPKTLADFSTIPDLKTLGTLMYLDQYLYTFNPDNSAVFRTAIAKPKAETAIESSLTISKLKCGTVMRDKSILIFESENNNIYEYNLENGKLEKKELDGGGTFAKAKAMATYFSYLYLLDPTQNQIFKYSRTLTGYGKGAEYITDETIDIKNAVSLAIDGNVYILNKSGEIIKLLKGKKDTFDTADLPTPLKNPTVIFTDPNTKYVYILDNGNSRVMVLSTKGEFIAQYLSDTLKDATGLYVNEETNKAYFTSDKKIYQFSITHNK